MIPIDVPGGGGSTWKRWARSAGITCDGVRLVRVGTRRAVEAPAVAAVAYGDRMTRVGGAPAGTDQTRIRVIAGTGAAQRGGHCAARIAASQLRGLLSLRKMRCMRSMRRVRAIGNAGAPFRGPVRSKDAQDVVDTWG